MVWSFTFFLLLLFFKNTEVKMMMMTTIILISKSYLVGSQVEFDYFFLDSMGSNMSHLSLILSCLALCTYMKFNDSSKSFLIVLSGFIAFLFFHCNNIVSFFILFEASLIPLVVMILGWGKQPERVLAGKYIMIYTLFSSFPLFCFITWAESIEGFFSMCNPLIHSNYSNLWISSLDYLMFLSFIIAFLVKIPMFFLHSWLPKAHVEAPLEGSIILAGIMLKVGTFGTFRLFKMFPSDCMGMLSVILFCVALLGSIFSIMMAVSSDDLKLSVALSSVSHMNFLLSSMFSLKELTFSMASFTMISHGFSSSMLFFFVTIAYEMNNSRSFALVKGSMSKIPSLILFSFLFFSLSIALPPSLAFFGEMLSISSIWSFSIESIPLICIFIMINSYYSMMNYGILNQSPSGKAYHLSNFETVFNFKGSVLLIIMMMTFFFPESIN